MLSSTRLGLTPQEITEIQEKILSDATPFAGANISEIRDDADYTEEHMHHTVRWFTKKAVQTATEWAVTLEGNLGTYYRCISGAGVYGADANDEAQMFGTADIPITDMVYGDFDEVLIVANSSSTLYLCRFIWGTGTMAEAITAGQYTEFPYLRGNADNVRKVMVVPCKKIPVTINGLPVAIWGQCANATNNSTLDFVVGVHGYDF